MNRALYVVLTICVLSACGAPATPTPATPPPAPTDTSIATTTPIPPTFTPEPTFTLTAIPTPTLPFDIPTSKEGKGVILGLVQQGGEPAAKVTVKMCNEYNQSGYPQGCVGQSYTTTTRKDGYYIFDNVVPGEYVVIVFISSNIIIINTAKESVQAGQTLILEPKHVYRDNLSVTSPKWGEMVKPPITFTWNAYPGAAYYELTTDFGAEPIRVDGTEYTLSQPAADCVHAWGVEAFDAEGGRVGTTTLSGWTGSVDHLSMQYLTC